jgi:hypothetical protein
LIRYKSATCQLGLDFSAILRADRIAMLTEPAETRIRRLWCFTNSNISQRSAPAREIESVQATALHQSNGKSGSIAKSYMTSRRRTHSEERHQSVFAKGMRKTGSKRRRSASLQPPVDCLAIGMSKSGSTEELRAARKKVI